MADHIDTTFVTKLTEGIVLNVHTHHIRIYTHAYIHMCIAPVFTTDLDISDNSVRKIGTLGQNGSITILKRVE